MEYANKKDRDRSESPSEDDKDSREKIRERGSNGEVNNIG